MDSDACPTAPERCRVVTATQRRGSARRRDLVDGAEQGVEEVEGVRAEVVESAALLPPRRRERLTGQPRRPTPSSRSPPPARRRRTSASSATTAGSNRVRRNTSDVTSRAASATRSACGTSKPSGFSRNRCRPRAAATGASSRLDVRRDAEHDGVDAVEQLVVPAHACGRSPTRPRHRLGAPRPARDELDLGMLLEHRHVVQLRPRSGPHQAHAQPLHAA